MFCQCLSSNISTDVTVQRRNNYFTYSILHKQCVFILAALFNRLTHSHWEWEPCSEIPHVANFYCRGFFFSSVRLMLISEALTTLENKHQETRNNKKSHSKTFEICSQLKQPRLSRLGVSQGSFYEENPIQLLITFDLITFWLCCLQLSMVKKPQWRLSLWSGNLRSIITAMVTDRTVTALQILLNTRTIYSTHGSTINMTSHLQSTGVTETTHTVLNVNKLAE